jgi:hypothetical protein
VFFEAARAVSHLMSRSVSQPDRVAEHHMSRWLHRLRISIAACAIVARFMVRHVRDQYKPAQLSTPVDLMNAAMDFNRQDLCRTGSGAAQAVPYR